MIIFVKDGLVVAWYDDTNAPGAEAHPGWERAWVPDAVALDVSDPIVIPDPRPGLSGLALAQAKHELVELDAVLPRAVEDMSVAMAAAGVVLTLPPVMRERMTRKAALRTVVAGADGHA
ncbi:hypothetical protein [Magnetospirillum moscoviense]|uniref:Uncharacterized protein n=1 Tax=Magnetospirillum moscoviense TaxID=1437059 RepID=A0A178N1S7_9PROT|nr:hypothetical protein [Magnetospirillum moscoviense]OAN64795.1 hypothetical protein A6A05_18940 [Magnetospirillum moscoviense]